MKHEPTLKAPLTVNWALNNSCNFVCRHCYSRNDTAEELDGELLCAAMKKVAAAGVLSVNFGGGEPLLRRDLLAIASCAAGCGMRVSMNSNGYLIDAEQAAALKKAGFSKVGISIDSHLAESNLLPRASYMRPCATFASSSPLWPPSSSPAPGGSCSPLLLASTGSTI